MQNDPRAAFLESARRLKDRVVEPRSFDQPEADPERRRRSLATCHRYSMGERPRKAAPRDCDAYVPELAARIDNDPNLSDGARRCGRKLAELTYRRTREERALPVTVTYLAQALGRCRRTVQRYLRQLEREGYVAVEVVAAKRTRMCVGLIVRLLGTLLAPHHRDRWPGKLGNPGATRESLIERKIISIGDNAYRVSVEQWARSCMDGVFRSFMKTSPLAGLPSVAAS
jgi:hypothetical protein